MLKVLLPNNDIDNETQNTINKNMIQNINFINKYYPNTDESKEIIKMQMQFLLKKIIKF